MTPKQAMMFGSPEQEDVVQDEEGMGVGILSEVECQRDEAIKFQDQLDVPW